MISVHTEGSYEVSCSCWGSRLAAVYTILSYQYNTNDTNSNYNKYTSNDLHMLCSLLSVVYCKIVMRLFVVLMRTPMSQLL